MTNEQMDAYKTVAEYLGLQKRESLNAAARRRLAADPSDAIAVEILRAAGLGQTAQWRSIVSAAARVRTKAVLRLVR